MVLLTLGTILLVQAATVVTATYYRHKYTQDAAVKFTATTIRILRASLAQVPPGQRSEFVRTSSHNEWHLWSHTLPSEARLENGRDAGHRRRPKHEIGRASCRERVCQYV